MLSKKNVDILVDNGDSVPFAWLAWTPLGLGLLPAHAGGALLFLAQPATGTACPVRAGDKNVDPKCLGGRVGRLPVIWVVFPTGLT